MSKYKYSKVYLTLGVLPYESVTLPSYFITLTNYLKTIHYWKFAEIQQNKLDTKDVIATLLP